MWPRSTTCVGPSPISPTALPASSTVARKPRSAIRATSHSTASLSRRLVLGIATSPRTSSMSGSMRAPSSADDRADLWIAGRAADDDLIDAAFYRLPRGEHLLLHAALREPLSFIERRLGDERRRVARVSEQAGHVGEDEERVGIDSDRDASGDTVPVHVERLVIGRERKRRDDRDAARSDELREQRKVHRLHGAGVVVAQQDRLSVLDRAHVLPLRDEESARDARESDGIDTALLELLDIEKILDPQRRHGEHLERASIGAAARVARWRGDRLLRHAERSGDAVRL